MEVRGLPAPSLCSSTLGPSLWASHGARASGRWDLLARGGRPRSPDLEEVVGESDQRELGGDLAEPAEQELPRSSRLFDRAVNRLGAALPPCPEPPTSAPTGVVSTSPRASAYIAGAASRRRDAPLGGNMTRDWPLQSMGSDGWDKPLTHACWRRTGSRRHSRNREGPTVRARIRHLG